MLWFGNCAGVFPAELKTALQCSWKGEVCIIQADTKEAALEAQQLYYSKQIQPSEVTHEGRTFKAIVSKAKMDLYY